MQRGHHATLVSWYSVVLYFLNVVHFSQCATALVYADLPNASIFCTPQHHGYFVTSGLCDVNRGYGYVTSAVVSHYETSKFAFFAEELNSLVSGVCDDDTIWAIGADSGWVAELATAFAWTSKLVQKLPLRAKHLDAMVGRVSNDYVIVTIDSDPVWPRMEPLAL